MEDISGLRGGQNHAPTATLATVSPTYSGRVTAGFRFIAGKNQRRLSGYGVGQTAVFDAFSVSATLAWRGSGAAATSDRDKSPRLWVQGNHRF